MAVQAVVKCVFVDPRVIPNNNYFDMYILGDLLFLGRRKTLFQCKMCVHEEQWKWKWEIERVNLLEDGREMALENVFERFWNCFNKRKCVVLNVLF